MAKNDFLEKILYAQEPVELKGSAKKTLGLLYMAGIDAATAAAAVALLQSTHLQQTCSQPKLGTTISMVRQHHVQGIKIRK